MMSESTDRDNAPGETRWEAFIIETAQSFRYPPTPDIAPAVVARSESTRRLRLRLAWAVVVTLALVAGGLVVAPEVRARVLEVLRIGAVRLFVSEPTGTPDDTSATPQELLSTPVPSILDLSGEVTLAEARATANFPIRLPATPADLGPPDRVYLQDMDGQVVVLVWLEPGQKEVVRMSLSLLESSAFAMKHPNTIQMTTVNGQPAVWIDGPYVLEFAAADDERYLDARRLVEGPVLLWEEGDITHRLEIDAPLEEAVAIAESLR